MINKVKNYIKDNKQEIKEQMLLVGMIVLYGVIMYNVGNRTLPNNVKMATFTLNDKHYMTLNGKLYERESK